LPAEPLRQPSIDVLLLLEVWVVCVVVVWVVVELVSGCWLGEVDDGDVDCCELGSGVVDCGVLGEVCATAHAADSNRIAVIRNVFLIFYVLLVSSAFLTPALRRVKAALST
jgi:hypothetical protein